MLNIKSFLSSPEGKIFAGGVFLFFIFLTSIITTYTYSVSDANSLVVMSFTNFVVGRAAGISYGYTAELNDSVIIFINMLIEYIMVMIIYPLFVLSWKKSVEVGFLGDFFTRVHEQRVKYKDYFEKYGKYGLFVFVWFPFWMTGPVIGAIIGFLIGIKHYHTITIVLAGTSLAIIIWTFFLKELIVSLNQLSANAPYIVLGSIIVIVVVLKFMKRKK